MPTNRHNFLSPPPDLSALKPKTKVDRELLPQANKSLQSSSFPELSPHLRSKLLLLEATASSAIEDSHAPKAIRLHHGALLRFTRTPLTETALLHAHRTIMTGQPHAQPGQYRSVNVTVGDHHPPGWEQVPELMKQFFSFTAEDCPDKVAQAAWAHMQFETIHPFADGNGRTGRAIINRILNSPVPISEYILRHRCQYYQHLAAGLWAPYLRWFAEGVIAECAL